MPDRPLVVALDDYEHSLRALADWSAVEARAELRVHHAPLHGEALLDAVGDADALVLMRDRTPLTAALVERLPKLKLVVFTGTRNAALDAAALARRGIPVCHTGWGPSKESTCELAWALILAAARRLPQAVQGLREGRWRAGAGALRTAASPATCCTASGSASSAWARSARAWRASAAPSAWRWWRGARA